MGPDRRRVRFALFLGGPDLTGRKPWLGALAVVFGAVAGCRSGATPNAAPLPATTPSLGTPVAVAPPTPESERLRNPLIGVPGPAASVPGVSISAAVIDLTTGRTWAVNPALSAYTASLVKVPIFLAFVSKWPPSYWSAKTGSLAAQMIEQSSNDAATKLWTRAGGATAVLHEIALLGMVHTESAPTLLEPWDGLRTTAVDQAQMMREVMRRTQPGSVLLLRLMEHPGSDQRWGVGVGLNDRWGVARKDGWVPVKGATSWTTSSIGVVTGTHISVAVAIITTGAQTYAEGRQVVNRVARLVDRRLELQDA